MSQVINEIKAAFRENKYIIAAATLIFIISAVLGFVLEPYLYSYLNPVVQDLTHKVQTGVIQISFHDIFLNNIMVVLKTFICGLLFCASVLILAFNGFFVGYFFAVSSNMLKTAVLIIPHGIFEFPSCILACASGFVLFKFAYKLIRTFLRENERKFVDRILFSYEDNFNILLHSFILLAISAILMAIAGFCEVYLTLPIGKFLYSILS